MSYKKLEIWQLSREISIKIHEVSIKQLPKFEIFEEGSQIRRSSKSVRSLIVEGYGKLLKVMEKGVISRTLLGISFLPLLRMMKQWIILIFCLKLSP